MGLSLTLWLAGGFAALAVFAGWRGARPPDPLRGPRLIPWRALMALSAVATLVFVVHLANLAGMTTGH